jgi:DNA-binding transcriptional LysR family regulator
VTFAQLRALHAVARTGNMTRAAEELGTTQPAVSHALRGLERELGVTLLLRRRDGVALTAAGRAVNERAATILAELEGLRQDAAQERERAGGRLRIGVIGSVNARLLPEIVRAFCDEHRDVTLGVLEGSDAEVLEWLQTGAVDVATLTCDALGVATTPLARDRMLAIVPAAHRLADRRVIALADLAQDPFVMPTGGCEPLILALAQRAGVELRCHYRVRDTAAIVAMVGDGLGVTIMPELCLPPANGAIRALALEPSEERSILLGLPADGAPLPAARAFVQVATAGS